MEEFFFFFQAEDGIRDADVTGVQTCALPIYRLEERLELGALERHAELQIRQGIGTRLKLGRRAYQLSQPKEAIFLARLPPRLLRHGALDRIQPVLRLERGFMDQESTQPVGHLRYQKVLDDDQA